MAIVPAATDKDGNLIPDLSTPSGFRSARQSTFTDQQTRLLRFIYDSFAVGSSEVAEFEGVSRKTALKHLHALEPAIVGTRDVNTTDGEHDIEGGYSEILWQTYWTYDNHTFEECLAESVKACFPEDQTSNRLARREAADIIEGS